MWNFDAVQEFIVAFFICATMILFLLVAIRKIHGLISLVVKHDAFILFSFSEGRESDNKGPFKEASHTPISALIMLSHSVQVYVSDLCCFMS